MAIGVKEAVHTRGQRRDTTKAHYAPKREVRTREHSQPQLTDVLIGARERLESSDGRDTEAFIADTALEAVVVLSVGLESSRLDLDSEADVLGGVDSAVLNS